MRRFVDNPDSEKSGFEIETINFCDQLPILIEIRSGSLDINDVVNISHIEFLREGRVGKINFRS